jgi:hypothetical protein
VARTLDRLREFTLFGRADGGDAAGYDLATFRDETLKQTNVLIIDLRRILCGEGAALAAAKKWAGHVSISLNKRRGRHGAGVRRVPHVRAHVIHYGASSPTDQLHGRQRATSYSE